jgi:hypothetical protein
VDVGCGTAAILLRTPGFGVDGPLNDGLSGHRWQSVRPILLLSDRVAVVTGREPVSVVVPQLA